MTILKINTAKKGVFSISLQKRDAAELNQDQQILDNLCLKSCNKQQEVKTKSQEYWGNGENSKRVMRKLEKVEGGL